MSYNKFFNKIHYVFQNKDLFLRAITHPSVYTVSKDHKYHKSLNYEKLEFLGDSVIGLIASHELVKEYKNEDEGILAKRKSYLVSGEVFASVAKEIGLDQVIIMSKGEELTGGRDNINNLENALESLMAAIYLDGGIDEVFQFFRFYFKDYLSSNKFMEKDPKSTLQEWAQKLGLPIPIYSVINTKGPSHSPIFQVEVSVEGQEAVFAEGSSKKIAERLAAKAMLEKLDIKNE